MAGSWLAGWLSLPAKWLEFLWQGKGLRRVRTDEVEITVQFLLRGGASLSVPGGPPGVEVPALPPPPAASIN